MRRHNPNAILMAAMPAATGYQWKRLFLPSGTLLRTVFGGKNHHCMVEGDSIIYDKRAVSPSGFVNAVGGVRRNAWKCTWVLFPESNDWKLADSLRTCERPRRARKPASTVTRDPGNQIATACAPITVPPIAAAAIAAPPISNPTISTQTITVPPLTVAPAHPERKLPHPFRGQVQRTDASEKERRRQPRADACPLPNGDTCATDRRANGSDPMTTLLRQELLPLLHRMCAIGEPLAQLRASRRTPTPRN